MKTVTLEVPDELYAALEAEREALGSPSVADAALRSLRAQFGAANSAGLEAEFAEAWNAPTTEFTDEVVNELTAAIAAQAGGAFRRA